MKNMSRKIKKTGDSMNVLLENNTDYTVDKKLIINVIRASLEYEHIPDNCEISVTIVTNDEIHQLNKKFRGIDSPTDVLSFPLIDFNKEELPVNDETIYLGDIVISMDRAKEQAESYGHSLRRELGFLTAHSMLHLLGYDHMVADEERVMFKKQEEILNILGLER